VITQDVPPDALAIGRSRQVNKENRAARLRSLKAAVGKKTPAAE
jgi:bifunctional N-acetylglucosamine-1-phosphate-uridyltransferase/glucosamine-1-phosphate-acetyltransferase GlmU-like protein